jgi:rare lipoprotein A
VASCYGRENGQHRTATGENYDPSRLTAAYWFAPLGALLRVLNLGNGRAITVRVNDRGPAKRLVRKGRIIDLSLGACRAIGSGGMARVTVQRIG